MSVREDLEVAIGKVMSDHGEFVTKWVALVETVDGDSDKALWTMSDTDSAPWDIFGVLAYATEKQREAMTADND